MPSLNVYMHATQDVKIHGPASFVHFVVVVVVVYGCRRSFSHPKAIRIGFAFVPIQSFESAHIGITFALCVFIKVSIYTL